MAKWGAGKYNSAMQPQYRRPGKLWYVSDGLIWDDRDAEARPDRTRPLECSSKLQVLNPQARATARVTVRFFHVDREPTQWNVRVGPGVIECIELASVAGVPHRQPFWIVVESDVPVLPQARHEDYSQWQQVPDALCCVTPYPGPLRDETHWVFPDCFEGGTKSWHEQETLTILNPRSRPVEVMLTYRLRKRTPFAAEKVTIPPRRVVALRMGQRYNPIAGRAQSAPLRLVGDYSIELRASGPVIPQITRRARWRDFPGIVGARSVLGFPLRSGFSADRWYYPGGLIVDRGILPRGRNFDVTWALLFTHHLGNRRRGARARLTFHDPAGRAIVADTLVIPPRDTNLQWLHLEPYLGRSTRGGEPFAITVESGERVLPALSSAEFEMFSQMCPGAMAAAHFYPGPLRGERTWWLGISPAGGDDEHEAQWQQMYHLFNPGKRPANVVLRFFGLGGAAGARTHAVTVGPGAVACVCSDELPFLPAHREFAVRADADQAICAQTTVRTFTRGLAPTRAMYGNIGLPMKLGQ